MTKFENYVAREIGNFIWDGFCDPAGVGVNIFKLLDGARLVGLNLTEARKDGILAHATEFGEWTFGDESVKQEIADATDLRDYAKMHAWLAFVVGDTTAAALVKNWQEEAGEILARFDRQNASQRKDSLTMTVKAWRETLAEELQDTDDPDDQDTIRSTAALLDGEDPETLAIQYIYNDPLDFKVLPYEASTKAEKILCRDLALN